MTVMSVELPDAIYQRVVELAKKEEITVNQLVSSALFEKLSAYMTKDYLEERARGEAARNFCTRFHRCLITSRTRTTDCIKSKPENEPPR